jgi:hypothetical protein
MPLALFASRSFVGITFLTLMLYGALAGLLVLVPYVLIRVRQEYPDDRTRWSAKVASPSGQLRSSPPCDSATLATGCFRFSCYLVYLIA